jgi:hypothetical protein
MVLPLSAMYCFTSCIIACAKIPFGFCAIWFAISNIVCLLIAFPCD